MRGPSGERVAKWARVLTHPSPSAAAITDRSVSLPPLAAPPSGFDEGEGRGRESAGAYERVAQVTRVLRWEKGGEWMA